MNIELLSVGISLVGILLLGYIVYINNPRSITNKSFFFLSITSSLWGIFNFLYNQPNLGNLSLLFLRIHLFFAVWYTFFTFIFLSIFPKESLIGQAKFKVYIVIVVLVSLITLTPFTFEKIIAFNEEGRIQNVKTGWGMFLFAGFVILLLIKGLFVFIKNNVYKTYIENKIKKSSLFFSIGIIVTFMFHIVFNLVLPNILKNPYFTRYGSIFTFPFILFSAYAILKYKFLNIRVLITETFITILLALYVIQTFQTVNLAEKILRLITLILLIIFATLLIKSVRKEVEQKEKLEQLNRIKSEFLSFASHQVKAPMAVVKGYAELIAESIENVPEQAKDFAKKIKNSVNNLLELVENFMDYRRIEEGKLELHFEEVEIVSLIKEIINNFQLIAKEKNLELTFNTQLEQFIIKADKMRIIQVIQNLIDNALKYTSQGWVRVSLSKDNDNILITVADSGIGMSKELQSRLFGEFVRDPSIKKEIRGTGLGLYIAKNIIEAHQGKIWAESEGEGRGSSFYIKLPLNI